MGTFQTTAQAFQAARTRASVAEHFVASLLHTAIYDAREAGMSLRETAAALRIPKSNVSRHWREGHHCTIPDPAWGNAEEYLAAQRAIWQHAPEQIEDRVPYEWTDQADGSRSMRHLPIGRARTGHIPWPTSQLVKVRPVVERAQRLPDALRSDINDALLKVAKLSNADEDAPDVRDALTELYFDLLRLTASSRPYPVAVWQQVSALPAEYLDAATGLGYATTAPDSSTNTLLEELRDLATRVRGLRW